MKVTAAFYLGYNYGVFIEEFQSMRAAIDALQAYVDNADGRTPCTDREACYMHLAFASKKNWDGYPDRVVTFGPRGGIKIGRC